MSPWAEEKPTHTLPQDNVQITIEETMTRVLESSCLPCVIKTLG